MPTGALGRKKGRKTEREREYQDREGKSYCASAAMLPSSVVGQVDGLHGAVNGGVGSCHGPRLSHRGVRWPA